MQKIRQPNRIYLSGGGSERRTLPFDRFFFNDLPLGGRFLYVPIALRGSRLYPDAGDWMKRVVDLQDRNDLSFEILTSAAEMNHTRLESFDGIYIGGGNVWSLIKELIESGASKSLIDYSGEGGRIYGGSAGAIILGKRIDSAPDKNSVRWKDTGGLSLLHELSVACHYTRAMDPKLADWAQDNGLPLLALPEGSGMIIAGDIATCHGEDECVLYTSKGERRVIIPGATMEI